jgi:DNA-binding CsgD family transcriptional regulator
LKAGRGRRLPAAFATFTAAQALAAVFFLGDLFADLVAGDVGPHLAVEAAAVAVLALGVGLGAVATRQALERLREQAAALDVARGAFASVVEDQFDRWGLTAAERDVALLALKGLTAAEIAAVRGAAPGTVRAQLSRVYAKAGVSDRGQFAALFVEELIGDGTGPTVLAGPPAGR